MHPQEAHQVLITDVSGHVGYARGDDHPAAPWGPIWPIWPCLVQLTALRRAKKSAVSKSRGAIAVNFQQSTALVRTDGANGAKVGIMWVGDRSQPPAQASHGSEPTQKAMNFNPG